MSQFAPVPAISGPRHKIIIDTDIGDDIDDALALALAARSPEIELLGVTTVFGDTRLRARLAAHVLRVAGREDIPIAAGLSTPLLPRHKPSGVPQAALLPPDEHYQALTTRSAPDLISQIAHAHRGQVTLVCIGPLTNIATTIQHIPSIKETIRNIVLMGGTSGLPLAEWNVRSDALAAREVLAAGIPVTLLGANITLRCRLRSADLLSLKNRNTEMAALLHSLVTIWQRHRPRWHPPYPYLHDPLTITMLCRPKMFRYAEMPVCIITQGAMRGYMLPRWPGGSPVKAVVDIQAADARAWVMERLLS